MMQIGKLALATALAVSTLAGAAQAQNSMDDPTRDDYYAAVLKFELRTSYL